MDRHARTLIPLKSPWPIALFLVALAALVYGLTRPDSKTPAVPNEKITWNKLDPECPKFMIHSDATIVAPLIFAYVLGQ